MFQRANPWMVILMGALVPALALVIILFKWQEQRGNVSRATNDFIQKQNSVLAYDALEVATGFSDILEKAARDVKILSLLPVSEKTLIEFHRIQIGDFTQFYSESEPPKIVPLPFYNREMILDQKGDVLFALYNGNPETQWKKFSQCFTKMLCDRELIESTLKSPVGTVRYGKLLRYYATSDETDDDASGSLNVTYRTKNGVVLLGIDYRHLKDHMSTPVFPYDLKRNLLSSYKNGNYIYVVDSTNDIIIHPKHWNAAGIDRTTGQPVAPMISDADEGKHPINIKTYRSGKLKDYFQRLLTRSFKQRGVDIFQAPNLTGKTRVLSVAPIVVSNDQFGKGGVFGYAIVGCSLDHFEEPKEKLVPYY